MRRKRLQNAMLADRNGQFRQIFLIEYFPWLSRIGADIFGRQKDHSTGFHIGFKFLTLHQFIPPLPPFYTPKNGKPHENKVA